MFIFRFFWSLISGLFRLGILACLAVFAVNYCFEGLSNAVSEIEVEGDPREYAEELAIALAADLGDIWSEASQYRLVVKRRD